MPDVPWLTVLVSGIVAGALGFIVFHGGTLVLLARPGGTFPIIVALFGTPPEPFRFGPGLFGLPALALQAIWGAVWGTVLAGLIGYGNRLPAVLTGVVLGAAVLTYLTPLVMPTLLDRHGLGIRPSREEIWTSTLAFAAWGWGTAIMLRTVIRR